MQTNSRPTFGSAPDVCSTLSFDSACGTCALLKVACSGEVPECGTCLTAYRTCQGYVCRPRWPHIKVSTALCRNTRDRIAKSPARSKSSRGILPSLSPLGRSKGENHLLQHYAKNIASIALAIDYHGNVYRSFLQMAMADDALLNAILAASASHLGRLQRTPDNSALYVRQALSELDKRLSNPSQAASPTTMAAILSLISHEGGRGTNSWKHHYEGLEGWLHSFKQSVKLDPFVKSWIYMAAFQAAMIFHKRPNATILNWLDKLNGSEDSTSQSIDPFLGYSVKLPRLLLRAAKLQIDCKKACLSDSELLCREEELQQEIASCKIDLAKPILLANACEDHGYCTAEVKCIGQSDLWRRAGATAEIFRHAAHIYVHRIQSPLGQRLPSEIQKSVFAIFDLLESVPDARGSGSNLTWPLFIVGQETHSTYLREQLSERWESLHLLGMESTRATERILVEMWRNHDRAEAGMGIAMPWQEVIQKLGVEPMMG